MRKNQLIKLLQELPGNPEIVLWNGFVGDYHPVGNLTEGKLVKHSVDHYKLRGLDETEAKKAFKKQAWEIPNDFVEESEMKNWYGNHQKTVYYIEAKLRGKTTYDRCGSMSY